VVKTSYRQSHLWQYKTITLTLSRSFYTER